MFLPVLPLRLPQPPSFTATPTLIHSSTPALMGSWASQDMPSLVLSFSWLPCGLTTYMLRIKPSSEGFQWQNLANTEVGGSVGQSKVSEARRSRPRSKKICGLCGHGEGKSLQSHIWPRNENQAKQPRKAAFIPLTGQMFNPKGKEHRRLLVCRSW